MHKVVVPVIVLGGVVLCLALMVAQLTWPYNVDQGIFAFVGSAIADGGMPYKDAWEHKGVMPHIVYGVLEILWGKAFWTVRLFDMLLTLCAMAGLVVIGRQFCHPMIALFGACLYGFALYPDNWASAQPDGWAASLMVLVVAALVRDNGRMLWRYALLVGVLMTIITSIKPFYLLFFLVPMAYVVQTQRDKGLRRKWLINMMAVTFLTGGALLLWLWLREALEPMWQLLVQFNLAIHSDGEFFNSEEKRAFLKYFFIDMGRWVVLLGSVMGLLFMVYKRYVGWRIQFLWLVLGLIFIVIQGKYVAYHCYVILPPMIIAVMYALNVLQEKLGHTVLGVLMVAMIYALHALPVFYVKKSWEYTQGEITQQNYYRFFRIVGKDNIPGQSSLNDLMQVARIIDDVGEVDVTLQLWGVDTLLYSLTHAKPASRFGQIYPLVAGGEKSYMPYREEFIKTMEEVQPHYIVVVDNDASPFLQHQTSTWHLKNFEKFDRFMSLHYDVAKDVNDYTLYQKREDEKGNK